ncbi:MAG: hypothetical protein AAGI08_04570, partial [Bacteroidota bacterium]
AAHVHFTLVSETYGRQWAPKVSLGDDPLVTDAQRQRSRDAGDFATVVEVVESDGKQHIELKIRLRREPDF